MMRAPRREASLADLLPYWRTLRDEGLSLTALVTPALDYVGALELTPLDARYASEEAIAATGEALRAFVSGTDDECTLHFLYRVDQDGSAVLADYVTAHTTEGPLGRFVASRADWLRTQSLRTVRLFLFYSPPRGDFGRPVGSGQLGARQLFARPGALALEAHTARLKALAALKKSLTVRLAQLGVGTRELDVGEVQQLTFELLNPAHAHRKRAPLTIRSTLWSDSAVRQHGEHLREYTEAEQLLVEDLEEHRGHLRQDGVFRRALTLKTLPEGATEPLASYPLLQLERLDAQGLNGSFPYWLSVVVHVKPQARTRRLLNFENGLVDMVRGLIPFLTNNTVARQEADAAKQESIRYLFRELEAMASKIVTLSVTLLLDAPTLDELDTYTQVAKATFASIGQSELLLEEISQLPAFLSVLPGAAPTQLRSKTCTSRNAGDFLPLFAPWQGSHRPVSLYTSPLGDVFRFDPFDMSLAPAHHGLVIADAGSGKSMTLGAMTIDALAAGCEAILVDKGRSWEGLTHLLGGIHLPVDIRTPMTPFRCFRQILDPQHPSEVDPEAIQEVVGFLELCTTEEGDKGFDQLTTDLVSRAVRRAYEKLRLSPERRPLMSDFRNAIAEQRDVSTHPDDKRLCDQVHRNLRLYVEDGLYGTFLDRPSTLRFDAPLITFEMGGVAKSRFTRAIAMATVMQTITARAAAKMSARRPTLVEIDEGHNYLIDDPRSAKFIGTSYREMRKFDIACWIATQQFNELVNSHVGHAIIGNSKLRLFLRHSSGHDLVANHFHFTPRQRQAFGSLSMRMGHHSDMFLMYAERSATLRVAHHPLAYWLLTTSGPDKEYLARAAEKNPTLSRFELLEHLARLYPRGAPRLFHQPQPQGATA